jgi:hypothetical protein
VNWKLQRGCCSSQSVTSWVPRVERLSLTAMIFWPFTTGISESSWSGKRIRSKRLRVFDAIASTSPS